MTFEVAQTHFNGVLAASFLVLIIAFSTLLLEYIKELSSDVIILNDGIQDELEPTQFIAKFHEFIDFHAKVNQLSEICEIFRLTIFFACILFHFQKVCQQLRRLFQSRNHGSIHVEPVRFMWHTFNGPNGICKSFLTSFFLHFTINTLFFSPF